MACKNCSSKKLSKILNFGKQPVSSVFYSKKTYNLKSYSLDLYICKNCNLVQFKSLAPLDEMYGQTYGYRTSLSKLMVRHIADKNLTILRSIKLKKSDYILDIGSNDGTFLNTFAKKNYFNCFGVDPSSEKFKEYYDKKINLICDYFPSDKLQLRLEKSEKFKSFKLISSFAMFYDIENPNEFCRKIYNLLDIIHSII